MLSTKHQGGHVLQQHFRVPQLGSGSCLGSKALFSPFQDTGCKQNTALDALRMEQMQGDLQSTWKHCSQHCTPGLHDLLLQQHQSELQERIEQPGLCLLHRGVREGAALPAQSALQLCRLRENFKVDHRRKVQL